MLRTETRFQELQRILRVDWTAGSVVHYWYYPSIGEKLLFTGNGANAHHSRGEVHSIHASDQHEIVHVLLSQLGAYDALLGEGAAVALSDSWQGLSLVDYVRKNRARLPTATTVAESFDSKDPLAYASAGFCLQSLISEYGISKFRLAYQQQGTTEERLLSGFGLSLSQLDSRMSLELSRL